MTPIEQFGLCIEFDEMVEARALATGLSREKCDSYLRKAKSIGTNGYGFIDDPADLRKVLLVWRDMDARYKHMIEAWLRKKNHCKHEGHSCDCGDPHKYYSKEPIRRLIVKDHKAEEFYLAYRFDETRPLPRKPIDYVAKYTRAASCLNMILKAEQDKALIKKITGTITNFYDKLIEIIREEDIDLPATYITLRRKIADFKENGYPALISGKFGNSNTAKIVDEVSEALLLKFLEHHNKFDDEQVARFYNDAASKLGYKKITPATVGVHRRKNQIKISMQRNGNGEFYDKFSPSIPQKRPSCPMARLENDDNVIDMYFWKEEKDSKGRKEINYYKRVTAIVVRDSYNDYPLGWACGESVSVELVRAAWLDAAHHIHELTGGWYLPHQVKNDRWALSALRPFYQSISVDYKDNVNGSKRNRYIEQSFGKKWHKELKEVALLNYAGYNVTAKQKLNRDAVVSNLKNFPHISEAPAYVSMFIDNIRQSKTACGLTLQEQWKQQFFDSEISQERQVSTMRAIELFGTPHVVPNASNPQLPNSITNEGIVATLCGEQYTYDVPEAIYLKHTGKNVQLIYSPIDPSQVLVTNFKDIRFLAHTTTLLPSAEIDHDDDSRALFFQKLARKRRLIDWVAGQKQSRDKTLADSGIDAYGILQAGVLTKEIKQEAEAFVQQIEYTAVNKVAAATAIEDAHLQYSKNNTREFL